jgi:hypothetical protein
MQEKMTALWQFVEPRLRILVIGVFLALLGLVFFLKSSEQLDSWTLSPGGASSGPGPGQGTPPGSGTPSETAATPDPATGSPAAATPANPGDALKEDLKPIEKIQQTLYAAPVPVEKSPYSALIAHSMFSIKTVQDQAGRDEAIKSLYEDAERLYREKKFAESLAKCDELLGIHPNHIQAQSLKQRLQQEMGGHAR